MPKKKQTEIEKIKEWFKDKEHLSVSAIERTAGIPAGLLSKALKNRQNLPEKHIPNLVEVLKKYCYK